MVAGCLLGEAEGARILLKDWALGWLNSEGLAQRLRGDEGDYDVVRVNFVPANMKNANNSTLGEQFSFGYML
jgi:hypothetical protein